MTARTDSARTSSTCATCGGESPAAARFCMHCAAALPLRCAACGADVPAAARFCPQCARPVAAPASPDSPPPARDPRAYTPKHLADKILQSKSALEGELTRALARVHTWPITLEICRALRTLDFHGDPRR